MNNQWVPEIYYEEADETGLTSHIPFVAVPDGEEMPRMLFIFESRETGDFEPGPDGEDLPVTQLDLHQYANMLALRNGLDSETYDKVREALGLEPMSMAIEAGRKISERVRTAVS
jgi:hypothetical protein